ncbi:MAG: methylamine utilization protein [Gammaproteobacteria bacterium]|nr:methylamine utilization protein [Gammaproteobacteria bacterium]
MRPPARAQYAPIAALLGGLALAGPAAAATLAVEVAAPDGRAVSGAVITAQPLEAAAHRPAPLQAVMDQVNRAFVPDLLVIPVGSTVQFPNSDSVSHQIYSFSPTKRFQLPLYRGKPYPPVHFDQAGVVTLGCNIHDEMVGYLLVTDAPHFGRTDAAGKWSAEVPGGRYHVTVWHPRLRDSDVGLGRDVTVGESERGELALRLGKSLQPAPLTDRPHSWD